MSLEKHIDTIFRFYYDVISLEEFMEYYNAQVDLQQSFDKALKSSPPDGYTVTQWLNKIYRSEDSPLIGGDKTKNQYLVWLFVQEFIAKGKTVKYLSKQEVANMILSAVTAKGAFYSATKEAENYIKVNIIDTMPPFETLNKAIKYVKEQMKLHFECDSKMPKWLQNCEWAFEDNKPMIFKGQIGDSRCAKYVFYSSVSGKEVTVKQFD